MRIGLNSQIPNVMNVRRLHDDHRQRMQVACATYCNLPTDATCNRVRYAAKERARRSEKTAWLIYEYEFERILQIPRSESLSKIES